MDTMVKTQYLKNSIKNPQLHYKHYQIWCLLEDKKTNKLEGILRCEEYVEKTEWDKENIRFYVKNTTDLATNARIENEFNTKLKNWGKKGFRQYGLNGGNVTTLPASRREQKRRYNLTKKKNPIY